MQVYSLISSLKTYHPTLHLTPWSLDLFIRVPFQLHREHTVLQPFRRIALIVHIAISVLSGTHFHLSQVKHLRVKCFVQGHNIINNVPRLRGEEHYISLKILHQAGFETARQAATSAERHAPTIAPCSSLWVFSISDVLLILIMIIKCSYCCSKHGNDNSIFLAT